MDWIIPMNLGLICDIIGATLITNSLFSLKLLRRTITFPDKQSTEIKELRNILEESSATYLEKETNEDLKTINNVMSFIEDGKRILQDRKFAKIGLSFLIVGFSLQIIANTINFYS